MEGFVTKKGSLVPNWKVRWLSIEGSDLAYYKDRNKCNFKGRYTIGPTSTVTKAPDVGNQRNMVIVTTDGGKDFMFSADTAQNQINWINSVQSTIDQIAAVTGTTVKDLSHSASTETANNARQSTAQQMGRNIRFPTTTSTTSNVSTTSPSNDEQNSALNPNHLAARSGQKRQPAARLSAMPSNRAKIGLVATGGTGTGGTASTTGSTVKDAMHRNSTDSAQNNTAEEPSQGKLSVSATPVAPVTASAAPRAAKKPASKYLGDDSRPRRLSASLDDSCLDARLSEVTAGFRNIHTEELPGSSSDRGSSSPQAENSSSYSESAGDEKSRKGSGGKGSTGAIQKKKKVYIEPATADSDSTDDEMEEGWIKAYTEAGELYYYHKVSREARWEKPVKASIAKKLQMEQRKAARQQEMEKEKERLRSQHQQEKQREEQQHQQQQQQDKTSEIENVVLRWANSGGMGPAGGVRSRELVFPEMLRDLALVLPADLLLEVYDSPHKIVLDSLQSFSIQSNPVEVKKAYLRVVRFIHPDKLPRDLAPESKLLTQRVFIHFTQKYELYRKAHEL